MTTTELPADITRTFSDIARTLFAAETVDGTLEQLVDLAVATVEGCDFAGVSIVQLGGDITTPAASHEKAAKCDELQYEFAEGPLCQRDLGAADLRERGSDTGTTLAQMGSSGRRAGRGQLGLVPALCEGKHPWSAQPLRWEATGI